MWEQPPHVERHSASGHIGLPSSTYFTRLHEKRSSWRDIRSDTRTAKSTSIEHQGSFLHTPTYGRGKGGEGGGGGWEMLAGDQSNIASSWSAKSSNMLPMSSRMDTVVFLLRRGMSQQFFISIHPSLH